VAKQGSEVLAYGMLRGWESGFEIPSLGIAVHPLHRGTGVARAFMLFLHDAARGRGARRIRLKVYPDNLAALRLYTALGYQVVGEESGQLVAYVDL
jgi:ribosomal protein S18 acetylase RimI-like enzyme